MMEGRRQSRDSKRMGEKGVKGKNEMDVRSGATYIKLWNCVPRVVIVGKPMLDILKS